jgi:hypothetical protein
MLISFTDINIAFQFDLCVFIYIPIVNDVQGRVLILSSKTLERLM